LKEILEKGRKNGNWNAVCAFAEIIGGQSAQCWNSPFCNMWGINPITLLKHCQKRSLHLVIIHRYTEAIQRETERERYTYTERHTEIESRQTYIYIERERESTTSNFQVITHTHTVIIEK
jgi:hypothetical protein